MNTLETITIFITLSVAAAVLCVGGAVDRRMNWKLDCGCKVARRIGRLEMRVEALEHQSADNNNTETCHGKNSY